MPQTRSKCQSCQQNKLDKFSNFAVNAKHAIEEQSQSQSTLFWKQSLWKDLICINEHFLIDLGQKLKGENNFAQTSE